MSVAKSLAELLSRDLSRLIRQIEAFPDDEGLWRTLPGITNSAGNLALHIEGNLREFVGRQLGQVPYIRKRELEFSSKGMGRKELGERLAEVNHSIPPIVAGLSTGQLEMDYPEAVLGTPMSTQAFLIHLYGHLNWHVGQVNYLRCIIVGDQISTSPSR